jgi:Cu/Ag efflux protein CusF
MKKLIAAAALAALALTANAQDKKPADKSVGAMGKASAVFVVDSIDQATRKVVLKDAAGQTLTFVAGDEVKNLPQVVKGDKVTFNVVEAVVLSLKKSASTLRERVETETSSAAPAGSKPAGTVTRSVKIVASVEAIDAKAGKVTVRGPQRTVDLSVKDPAVLKEVKVGDMVEAIFAESVTIKVEKGMASPAAPAKK